jgi:hypothetical protein
MRIASTLLVALAAATVATTATANPIAYDGSYYAKPERDRNPDHHLQPEVGLGFIVGSFGIGPISGPAYGMQLGAGVRLNRIALIGEYNFMTVGQSSYDDDIPDPVRGIVHRVGASLRYSFGVLAKPGFPLRGEFWVEAGGGRQFLRWYDGGKLSRNDVSLGLAGQLSVRWGESRRKKLGIFYALKLLGSQRPDEKWMPPTCAGPCDEPTGPIPYDLGIFFHAGLTFGR